MRNSNVPISGSPLLSCIKVSDVGTFDRENPRRFQAEMNTYCRYIDTQAADASRGISPAIGIDDNPIQILIRIATGLLLIAA